MSAFYQLVTMDANGRPISHESSTREEFAALMQEQGHPQTGEHRSTRTRAELDGQPKFQGVNGPMYNGARDGVPFIRYECPEAYAHFSE